MISAPLSVLRWLTPADTIPFKWCCTHLTWKYSRGGCSHAGPCIWVCPHLGQRASGVSSGLCRSLFLHRDRKQKYKCGRQNPFISVLLLVQVSWAAEITEPIGPITGMASFSSFHLDYFLASRDISMYFSSHEWDWLQPHVSTRPSLASSPTCLEHPHPKRGCASRCADTATLQRHGKRAFRRDQQGSSLFRLHPKPERKALQPWTNEPIHWKWGERQVTQFRNVRAELRYAISGPALLSLV